MAEGLVFAVAGLLPWWVTCCAVNTEDSPLLELLLYIKSVLHNLKTSFGRPKLDTWCITESIGLAIGLSGATFN